jgi:hypothetical protein
MQQHLCIICRRSYDFHSKFLNHTYVSPYEKVCKKCNVMKKDHKKGIHKFEERQIGLIHTGCFFF